MFSFCTHFNKAYLLKGLSLINSLKINLPEVRIYVLCLDDITFEVLSKLEIKNVKLYSLADIETSELLNAKANRSLVEYFWTLTPCFTHHVLTSEAAIDSITYVDSDLLFFSSPKPVFEKIGQKSIGIVPHNFAAGFGHLEKMGKFCVEFIYFRKDQQGLDCLREWRRQCLEWCYDKVEKNRMADQKYLDFWPEKYSKLCIVKMAGVGVAPWNFSKFEFSLSHNGYRVNGLPLIYYHFHQFSYFGDGQFDWLSNYYKAQGHPPVSIYRIYERDMMAAEASLPEVYREKKLGLSDVQTTKLRRFAQNWLPSILKSKIKQILKLI